ncbi:hypothetical protein [Spirochaeta thermophila]|uniref:Uncharacterized protein n=1 Tax=Winmispira thermophila (strain ATCC 49972 / DSM 6192 / RI 19.B1) TaxID=665571 RepID=E0RNP6_WINT6|nr:hypothetical protein [Spirochaeta thermophila]ADN02637.1 hypothetical protein STHERM_c17010 [Spirochaeta thermophila DSM 6192]
MEEQVPAMWPWGLELGIFVPLTHNLLFRFSADTYNVEYFESWGIKLSTGVSL